MKSNFQRTADWLAACGKEPTLENLSVQFGCHLEEICELLLSVSFRNSSNNALDTPHPAHLVAAHVTLTQLADGLKLGRLEVVVDKPLALLDALCDCEVTGNGVAYQAGFDKVTADELVLLSNERKLVDGKPVIKEGGKIGKPEGWVPPDLSDCI